MKSQFIPTRIYYPKLFSFFGFWYWQVSRKNDLLYGGGSVGFMRLVHDGDRQVLG